MKTYLRKIGTGLIIAVTGGLIALGADRMFDDNNSGYTKNFDNKVPGYLTSDPVTSPMTLPDFTVAADQTIHAVVHITTEYDNKRSSVYDYFFDFRDFFGDQGGTPQPLIASGSGVIVSPDGYIVTNNHVVTESDKIEVTLNNKRSYEAKVIGTDPSTDLALIKIDASELPYMTFGNSDDLKIGEWVLAVGNPFNLTSTVTAGIVSAKARNINILGGSTDGSASSIESFIQTDAAVNRGNSGGALVNTRGELIGINAAIASGTGYYAGYSFAIPSNLVRKVAADLRDYGTVQRAYIGVNIRELDNKLATEAGINDIQGVYIADVTDNGAAKEAGLKSGDVILKVENVSVNSPSELLEVVGQHNPGDKVDLIVRRNNKDMNFNVVLKNSEGSTSLAKREEFNAQSLLGADFNPVSEKTKEDLGIDHGIQIAKLSNGKLRNAGIREGFIITKIDGKDIKTEADVASALGNKKGGVLVEGIYPNRTRAYYGFGL
ncbi:MAG TPA: Do family serine endopeptidase [Lentimicrobium sp.]|nr:Do family serine endopeptidase [Lentimicrobium sp.]